MKTLKIITAGRDRFFYQKNSAFIGKNIVAVNIHHATHIT